MIYTQSFVDSAKLAKENNVYLGTGNPNSKVLIIGKDQAYHTAQKEMDEWMSNIANSVDVSTLADSNSNHEILNPLYPFKGQPNKVEYESNGGTNLIWYSYQKLYDNLFNDGAKSEQISFHESVFITEFNDKPVKNSKLQKKGERELLVTAKCKYLKESAFFQNMPIVIITCGHYPEELGVDVCDVFGVGVSDKANHAGNDASQWYNLHYGVDQQNPKLLVHTRQLGMNTNDLLLKEVADVIKHFCVENNISL